MALDKLQFDRTAAAPGTFSTDMLNRIEDWTAFLADKLRGYGYAVNITPRNAERPQTSRLPDGYTELEYIASTGTQCIDTGFKPNQDTQIIADLFVDYSGSQTLHAISAIDANFNFIARAQDGWVQRFGKSNFVTISEAYASSERVTIERNGPTAKVGNISNAVTGQGTFQNTTSIAIFARHEGNNYSAFMRGRIYNVIINQNGINQRNMVPARQESDKTVGLYDLVQPKFYANAGTGAFIAGAEAPPPEPLDPALWYQSDIPTRGEIDRIRRNVDALQTGFARLPDWREILYNNTVDFGQANALEWDLQRIYDWMNAMTAAFLTRQANTIFMQAGGILNA
jgi:hypothetical protein